MAVNRLRNLADKGELIDTLWNVNERTVSRTSKTIFELIDTLWNVNELRWNIKGNTGYVN